MTTCTGMNDNGDPPCRIHYLIAATIKDFLAYAEKNVEDGEETIENSTYLKPGNYAYLEAGLNLIELAAASIATVVLKYELDPQYKLDPQEVSDMVLGRVLEILAKPRPKLHLVKGGNNCSDG